MKGMTVRELVALLIEQHMDYVVTAPEGDSPIVGITEDYDNKEIRLQFKEVMYSASDLKELTQQAVEDYKLLQELGEDA